MSSRYNKEMFVGQSAEMRLNTFVYERVLRISTIKMYGDIIRRVAKAEALTDMHPELPQWIDSIAADAAAVLALDEAIQEEP